jgi:hypothetical protein
VVGCLRVEEDGEMMLQFEGKKMADFPHHKVLRVAIVSSVLGSAQTARWETGYRYEECLELENNRFEKGFVCLVCWYYILLQ